MTDAFCGFLTFIVYGIYAMFMALVSVIGSVIVLSLGAGILSAVLYGCGVLKDNNTQPTENTREW